MRLNRLHRNIRGDTLVEVMLAAAILSLVIAGAFSISNRATRLNQNSNERTDVSNLMQREAELIRASSSRDAAAFWGSVNSRLSPNENGAFCESTASQSDQSDDGAFYLNDDLTITDITISGTGDVQDFVPTDLFDIWVEAVNGPGTPATHTDFFIYGCWEGIGGDGLQRTGLVVRLSR